MTTAPSTTTGALKRLLIVADEEIVLVALRETLRQQGYAVATAQNAVQGLETLQQQQFAAVLSDQQMPMLSGLEFLAQARKIQPDASRILVTAVLNVGTVIDAINKAEIFRFLLKPWQREELLRTIQEAVERYETLCRHRILLTTTLAVNDTLTKLAQSLEKRLCRK
jgi:DNA-binding NtrC family response regulator